MLKVESVEEVEVSEFALVVGVGVIVESVFPVCGVALKFVDGGRC